MRLKCVTLAVPKIQTRLNATKYLYAWECGYDEDGCWDDERAASALRGQRMAREKKSHAHDRIRAALGVRREMHDLLPDLHAVRAPHRQLGTLASAQVRGAAQRARKAGATPVVHGTDLGGAQDP